MYAVEVSATHVLLDRFPFCIIEEWPCSYGEKSFNIQDCIPMVNEWEMEKGSAFFFNMSLLRLVNDASTDNRTASNLVNLLLPEVKVTFGLSRTKSISSKGT